MPKSSIARRTALALLIPAFVEAQGGGAGTNAPAQPSIAAKTIGFERRDGFVPLYIDSKQGRLFAELPGGATRALFWVSLASGFGSNPLGLDRGASRESQVVRFDRDGDREIGRASCRERVYSSV